MKLLGPLLAPALLCVSLTAQTRVADVGLTLDVGPTLPAFVGYDCGAFSCQAFDVGGYAPGSVRTFKMYGAPQSLYVLAAGTPGPCRTFLGVGNALLLTQPAITLKVGFTGPFIPGLNCNQGMDTFRLIMPRTAPLGLQLRFQSLGVSNTGIPAFGPGIDAVIR